MSDSSSKVNRILDLTQAICDKSASESDFVELDAILLADEASRRYYLDSCRMRVALRFELRANRAAQEACQQISIASIVSAPVELDVAATEVPSIVPGTYPTLSFLGNTIHSTAGYFSSGWPLAYLIATVIFGIGLAVGSHIYVSQPAQVAQQSTPLPSPPSPLPRMVGRITGMVDCQWAENPKSEIRNPKEIENQKSEIRNQKSLVALGDTFALASGLMEITYDTGARVILQGPARYAVESTAGGYLSLGKLTARMEKKGNDERRMMDDEFQTVPSDIHHSSLITHHLFSVRTPTAIVTDLGTEFGVEVGRSGATKSHVFRGAVKVQVLGAGADKQGSAIVLREGEAAQTQWGGNDGGTSIVMRRISSDPKSFVRRLVRTPKTLDLLDIVAGGNGIGRCREHGIDPTTAMEDASFVPGHRVGDRQYRNVAWSKLIDGVFVPNGGAGPVTLDSAGHTFDRFPATAGETFGSIWARAATFRIDDRAQDENYYWIYVMGPGREYMPRNSGLLCLHSNTGITLNLQAIREKYSDVRPVRFRTTAGVAHKLGLADVWVLIDGRLKFERRQFRMKDGPVSVEIEIGPADRFLTLVSTDCGGSIESDWVVFGDPVLETAAIERDGKEGSL